MNDTWLTANNHLTLIVTSANIHDEPIISDDKQAYAELNKRADKVISHNRNIVTKVDDSVVKAIETNAVIIRRARGYVPQSIKLAREIRPVFALGSYLKNTLCLTKGNKAYLSQHIGNLNNRGTINFFWDAYQHLTRLLNIKPNIIACDLHPNFNLQYLKGSLDLPVINIQHHHAHLAAVVAEHHLEEPVLGWALDGYGYGEKAAAWGGELLLLEGKNYKRIYHLQELALPGGDKAAQQPWRMGASVLHALGLNGEITNYFATETHAEMLASWLSSASKSVVPTTSCGRYFDAAAALLGVCSHNQYESQAAMQLEALVTIPQVLQNGWELKQNQLSLLPLFKILLEKDKVAGSNLFHGTLAHALVEVMLAACKEYQISKVVLAGGCFCNQIVTQLIVKKLHDHQVKVFLPQQSPVNDGNISLGQAWIAGQEEQQCV